ncbi:MAG TPA: tetratricopeptide repeat protein [Tepidisphaeraceae bacterium]|jgi:tetratricopeptide (TPR) repeat protein|nr:tetratricopeptide repeat protein [Tepidisphaeraceae bacterium]
MTAPDIQQLCQLALAHHRSGRLSEAESLYRQVIAQAPDHADALNLLGVLEHQRGRSDEALALIRRAIRLNPNAPVYHNNLGLALVALGRLEEAEAAYRQAILLRPDYADAHYSLGWVLQEKGQLVEATAAYDRAIAANPAHVDAHNNAGNLLARQGRWDEAAAAYRRAVALRPNYAGAWANLAYAQTQLRDVGNAIGSFKQALAMQPHPEWHYSLGNLLNEQKRTDEATVALSQAIASRPEFAEAHMALGNVLLEAGRAQEATESYRQALRVRPDFTEAQINLAHQLVNSGQLEEAMSLYDSALKRQGDDPETCNNLANVLQDLGRVPGAIAMFRQAIELRPGFAEARFGLGLALLLTGNFGDGWPLYEERWAVTGRSRSRGFTVPLWDGGELVGRRIFLHTEQGLGDAIQFIRYMPQVQERGGRVIVGCFPQLRRLFEDQLGIERVVAEQEPLPVFEVHCPLLSLPRVFGTTLETIPSSNPYLQVRPEWTEKWKSQLPRGMNIGLVWSGNPEHKKDRDRSIPVSSLAPLGQIKNVSWISLQKGAAIGQVRPQGLDLLDFTAELKDLADTAGLIHHLDLVIAVDTAVAHLAGAMGKPVWLLLPFAPDWRWLLDREDSPWYPTMRLFRQRARGRWDDPLAQIVNELRRFHG